MFTVKDIGNADFQPMDRTKLADQIEKYYVGHKRSNIGMQYVDLKDGKIVTTPNTWERKDFARLWVENDQYALSAWIEPPMSGSKEKYRVSIESAHRRGKGDRQTSDVSDVEKDIIRRRIAEEVEANREYVDRQLKYLSEKPWEQLDGLTPEDAVAKLRELGW